MEGWLWPWLTGVLMASAFIHLRPRYAAEVYSPTGVWDDEGIWQLVNDFLIDRGVDRGAIESALTVANTTAGVERYLEVALVHVADRLEEMLGAI
jgi:hypothetical protein